MARPNSILIDALRQTADRLAHGAHYRWTHMGACNCGHLAQTVTDLPAAQIHQMALQKAGDWSEQAVDYCPASGYPIDHVISRLLEIGLTLGDLETLEKLSSKEVLRRLPEDQRHLSYRQRTDVVRYMRAWADLLEERLQTQRAVQQLAASGQPRNQPEGAQSRPTLANS